MNTVIEHVCEQYLNPNNAWMFRDEVHRAMSEFLGSDSPLPPRALPFFIDWFVFDFPMFGSETPIVRFHSMNPLDLEPAILLSCKKIIEANAFDFFEVVEYRQGGDMKLRGLRGTGEYVIPDTVIESARGDVIVSRIVPMGGHWEIASADPIGMPAPSKRDARSMQNGFPVLDSRVVYHEIVAAGYVDMPYDIETLENGAIVTAGASGGEHADDGCPVCVLLRTAKQQKRTPTEEEVRRAFKEAGGPGRDQDKSSD